MLYAFSISKQRKYTTTYFLSPPRLAVWTLGTLFLFTGNHGKIKFLFNRNINLSLLSCQLLWQTYTELCGLVRNTNKSFRTGEPPVNNVKALPATYNRWREDLRRQVGGTLSIS